jgi:hypothetical protein
MSDRIDPRLGLQGSYEPLECAVTGQWPNGRHSTVHYLGNGYYFTVLRKAKHLVDIPALVAELSKLIAPPKVSYSKKQEGEQS